MSYSLSIEREEGYIRVDLHDPFTQADIDGHHNVMVIDPPEMRDALVAAL